MNSLRAAEKVTEKIGDLPAMPAIVSEVLHLMEDPMVDMRDICNCLQKDPALTAKILRVSNSSYYGMKQYVGTLKLALVVLGAREVRNIVLGVSVFDTFGRGKLDAALPLELWEHSVRVAGLCKMLGARMRLALQGEDFIGGLLHDIGKLILWAHYGAAYEKFYFAARTPDDAAIVRESETFGFDHCDAAAALATQWNLPLALRDALWMHHPQNGARDLDAAKDPMLAALVRVANLASRGEVAGADADGTAGEDASWRILAGAPAPIPAGEREATIREYFEEHAQAPVPAL